MKQQDILLVFEYNYWANNKVLAASAKASEEQWLAQAPHSYGNLRNTLVHTLDAEYGWRMLCQQKTITPELDPTSFSTLAVLEQRWRSEEQAMHDYLAALTDEDLLGFVHYETDTGEQRARVLWHCLYHVVNHGTQHRGEAAAILTEFGYSPGELDFTVFLNEQGGRSLVVN